MAGANPTDRLNDINQLTLMPDAIWPTAAAPAAPTPLNTPAPASVDVPISSNPQYADPVALQTADPTMTTSTGAVKSPTASSPRAMTRMWMRRPAQGSPIRRTRGVQITALARTTYSSRTPAGKSQATSNTKYDLVCKGWPNYPAGKPL